MPTCTSFAHRQDLHGITLIHGVSESFIAAAQIGARIVWPQTSQICPPARGSQTEELWSPPRITACLSLLRNVSGLLGEDVQVLPHGTGLLDLFSAGYRMTQAT